MMTLTTVKASVHERYLKLRALDRIIQSRRFAAAFSLCAEDDTEVDQLIETSNAEGLELWINRILVKELEDLAMRDLRMRASALGIPFYTTYRKDALILKILQVQNASKTENPSSEVSLEEKRSDIESFGASQRGLLHPTGT